jgi:SAM-dependent methyltransferase
VLMVDDVGKVTVLGRGHAGTLDLAEIDGLPPEAVGDYLSRSQRRWKGAEGGPSLTWGRMMSGDTFIDAVQRARPLVEEDVVLEIGPGYGRLLNTILERGLPFRKYFGLDISNAKVADLQQKFEGDGRIQFQQCDAISGPLPQGVTVVLCSGTLEHLFPNVRGLLANLRIRMGAPFHAFLDFKADERFMRSMAWFEEGGGAFVRTYLREELETLLAESGYRVLDIPEIILGRSLDDIEIRRYLVVAECNP